MSAVADGGGGRDEEDRDGEDSRAGETESFADLIGDVKSLDPTPERAKRPAPRAKPRADGSAAAASAARFRFPDAERPRFAAARGVNDRQLQALARGEPEPDERVDLHGVRRDAVARLLAARLESARAQGLRCVIVIHGRGKRSGSGDAVLRDGLAGWLTGPSCAEHVLAFAPAPPRLGGDGATLVLLARQRR